VRTGPKNKNKKPALALKKIIKKFTANQIFIKFFFFVITSSGDSQKKSIPTQHCLSGGGEILEKLMGSQEINLRELKRCSSILLVKYYLNNLPKLLNFIFFHNYLVPKLLD
jgi:hypothetical protein